MSRSPVIADHPDRAAIEIGLANNVALRTLGKRYGLTITQLSRYRSEHMSDELVARLRTRGSRSDEELGKIRDIESKNLLDHLAWQRGRLYTVADRAMRIGDDAGETRALAEAGRTSERIAKLLGDMPTGTTHITNNLVVMPDYHRLRTILVRKLRPHTTAHVALIEALQEFEQTQIPAIEHAA